MAERDIKSEIRLALGQKKRTTRTQYGPGTLGEWEVNL